MKKVLALVAFAGFLTFGMSTTALAEGEEDRGQEGTEKSTDDDTGEDAGRRSIQALQHS